MKQVALVLCCLLLACGRGASDAAWVADVDGVKIPAAELRRLVDQRLEDSPDANREDVVTEELNRLVSAQVALNHAAKAGVSVSEAEVAARLREIHGEEWKDDDPKYREEVRREMTIERIAVLDLAPRARVPDSEVHAYFDEHRREYAQPARVQVRQIVVEERPKAEALHARLEQGGDFAALARANSLAPEAPAGGELPPFARGELPEAFDRAFELAPGQISPVIESPYGFHIFLLERTIPASEPTFDEMRPKLEAELGQRHLEELRREWLRGLRKSAEIHERRLAGDSAMRRSLCLFILLLAASATPRAEVVDGVAAIVGDEVVLLSEVRTAMQSALARVPQGQTLTPDEARQLRDNALKSLIDDKLVLQVAKRQGVGASEEEIDAAVAGIAQEEGISVDAIYAAAAQQGLPRATYREQLGKQITRMKMVSGSVQGRVRVSDEEVHKLYDERYGQRQARRADPRAAHPARGAAGRTARGARAGAPARARAARPGARERRLRVARAQVLGGSDRAAGRPHDLPRGRRARGDQERGRRAEAG